MPQQKKKKKKSISDAGRTEMIRPQTDSGRQRAVVRDVPSILAGELIAMRRGFGQTA